MLTQDRSARGKNVMVEQMKVSRITLQWAGSKMGSKSSGDSPQKSEYDIEKKMRRATTN